MDRAMERGCITVRCAVCGKVAATKWTLNKGSDVAIVELCREHGEPLMEVFDLGRVRGPREPARVQPGVKQSRPAPKKGRDRLQPFDWEPPTE